MRYVQDAPLKSIRADLRLATLSKPTVVSFGTSSSGSSDLTSRIQPLEAHVETLERTLQLHAQELTAWNVDAKKDPITSLIQNTSSATVHQSSPNVFGRARCGWCYDGPTYRSRRRVAASSYHILPNLDGIPGDMICDRCLSTEGFAAFNKDIIHDELNGDEQPVDVQI